MFAKSLTKYFEQCSDLSETVKVAELLQCHITKKPQVKKEAESVKPIGRLTHQ